jgi:hypothetical protein
MDAITLDPPEARLNQTPTITASFHNEDAPLFDTDAFTVRILINGKEIAPPTLFNEAMDINAGREVSERYTFSEAGKFTITAELFFQDEATECDTTNNRKEIEITIEIGDLEVSPNPFTPNGDGTNDAINFDANTLDVELPLELTIFDMKGRIVYEALGTPQQKNFVWRGQKGRNDVYGKELLPCVYLYVLKDAKNKLEKGYVILAR